MSRVNLIVVLLISLGLAAGCVAVSAERQTTPAGIVLAPHLPLLEWQGYGTWGDAHANTCKQLNVYFGNAMAAGYCGEGRETCNAHWLQICRDGGALCTVYIPYRQ